MTKEDVLAHILKNAFYDSDAFNNRKVQVMDDSLIIFGDQADGGAGQENNIFLARHVSATDITNLFLKWYSGTYTGDDDSSSLVIDSANQRIALNLGPSPVNHALAPPVCNQAMRPYPIDRVMAQGIDVFVWLKGVPADEQKCLSQRLGAQVKVSGNTVGFPIFLYGKKAIQLSLSDRDTTFRQ